jgi:hypothetical protein
MYRPHTSAHRILVAEVTVRARTGPSLKDLEATLFQHLYDSSATLAVWRVGCSHTEVIHKPEPKRISSTADSPTTDVNLRFPSPVK